MFHARAGRRIDVGHFLVGDFGDETVPHRHDYFAEWIVGVESLDENGFSVDIALMEELLSRAADELEGKLLNDIDFFANRQTSVENFALYLLQRLDSFLTSEGVRVPPRCEVRIWESDTAWASVTKP